MQEHSYSGDGRNSIAVSPRHNPFAPDAPIDNNIVERALKKAILNRKNILFYKTLNGAGVGDLFMSLIHTCELNGASSFDYLTELQRHAAELKQKPAEWMPWNYRETLATLTTPAAARRDGGRAIPIKTGFSKDETG
jgi:hypothetical protein